MEYNPIVYKIKCSKCGKDIETQNIWELYEDCEECDSPQEISAKLDIGYTPDLQELNQIYQTYLRNKPRQYKLDTFKLARCNHCNITKFRHKNLYYCPDCGKTLTYEEKDANHNFPLVIETWIKVKNQLFELLQMKEWEMQEKISRMNVLYMKKYSLDAKVLNEETKEKSKSNDNFVDEIDDLLHTEAPIVEDMEEDIEDDRK
jgi:uncharacterized Zn finger protein (UPF0148 family)